MRKIVAVAIIFIVMILTCVCVYLFWVSPQGVIPQGVIYFDNGFQETFKIVIDGEVVGSVPALGMIKVNVTPNEHIIEIKEPESKQILESMKVWCNKSRYVYNIGNRSSYRIVTHDYGYVPTQWKQSKTLPQKHFFEMPFVNYELGETVPSFITVYYPKGSSPRGAVRTSIKRFFAYKCTSTIGTRSRTSSKTSEIGIVSVQDVLRLDEDRSYVNLRTGMRISYTDFLNTDQLEGDELEFRIYVNKTGNPILDDYVLELKTNLKDPYWCFGDYIYHSGSVIVWKGKGEHEYPFPSPIILSGKLPESRLWGNEVYVKLTVGMTKDGAAIDTVIQKLDIWSAI